jgi:hypothetical protein
MIYVALDPGATTGAAIYNGADKIATTHFPHFEKLNEIVEIADVVIYEKPFMKQTTDPIVFEVKGAILECVYRNQKKLQPQAATIPSAIEKIFSDLWKGPKVKRRLIHERDALAHLVFFLVLKTKQLTIQELGNML